MTTMTKRLKKLYLQTSNTFLIGNSRFFLTYHNNTSFPLNHRRLRQNVFPHQEPLYHHQHFSVKETCIIRLKSPENTTTKT